MTRLDPRVNNQLVTGRLDAMPPNAAETKRRILEAARSEFAEHGLAGARVDRIAETGNVNKRSIYVHFGPKDALFDIIVARSLTEMAEAVPFTVEDLPGYAGALFDYLIEHPEVLRLTSWAGLERPDASADEVVAYAPKIAALSAKFGRDAVDILALLLGQVTAWQYASPALKVHSPEDPWSPDRLKRHRAMLVTSVASCISAAE